MFWENLEHNEVDSGYLGVTLNGNKINSVAFKVTNGKSLTNAQLEYYATELANKQAAKGLVGSYCVSASYNIGWRTGRFKAIGDMSEAYDPKNFPQYDGRDIDFEEKCTEFILYFLEGVMVAGSSGGIDHFNDCFYNALLAILGDKIPKKINTAIKLKNYLGIAREAKVNAKIHVPLIEILLKNTSINIIGDVEYYSELKDTSYTITLRLLRQHYYLNYIQNLAPTTQVSFIAKTVNELRTYCIGDNIITYNGRKYAEFTVDEFNATKKTFKFLFIKSKKPELLKEDFDLYVKNQAEMLKVSGGKVNMFCFPTYSLASLHIWKTMTPMKEPAALGDIEGDFHSKTFMGGIRYAQKGYEGPYHLYDINSMYPYYMMHKDFNVPVMEGRLVSLPEFGKYFQYGMYRCTIEKSEDENINKLFKFNSKNFYSHYDLKAAKLPNLKISLLPGVNGYLYDKVCLNSGTAMFSSFVKLLYQYKSSCKPFKQILNSLWGSLCQRNNHKQYVNIFKSQDIPFENIEEFSIDGSLMFVKYTKEGEQAFLTNHARVGMILTSFCRYKFIEQVHKFKDVIVKIHTDSVMTTEPIPLELSTEMGGWKLEHFGTCKIINGNKTIYNKEASLSKYILKVLMQLSRRKWAGKSSNILKNIKLLIETKQYMTKKHLNN